MSYHATRSLGLTSSWDADRCLASGGFYDEDNSFCNCPAGTEFQPGTGTCDCPGNQVSYNGQCVNVEDVCSGPGLAWDYNSGKCISLVQNVQGPSGGGTSTTQPVISKGEIPELLIPVEEAKKGFWATLALAGGVIGVGMVIGYITFGGDKPSYKPEFTWED